ncbi:MAG: M10 family metallopeptidase C-terminal domain-containing protein, partial [Caulobacteraceae bacterium]
DENAPGTFYSCIWDAGGTDTINYVGDRDTVIDLRAATLKYEAGGGGFISYAWGIFGGFTIANGVTIERAAGGSGNDHLTGNDAANRLTGNGGRDWLDGGLGRDVLSGGAGRDKFVFDVLDAARDRIADLADNDKIDLHLIDADITLGDNQAFVLVDGFGHHAGEATLLYKAGTDTTLLKLDVDGDGRADMTVAIAGNHTAFENFVL